MKMNTKRIISAVIVLAFVGGGFWYYQSDLNRQTGPIIPLLNPSGQAFNLPTEAPHTTLPTTPPPSVITPSKPVVTSSGIKGSVFIGPTCPVQRIPPDPNCADKPFATTLVAKDGNGVVVKTFSSNANGTFEVSLPAGEYHVGPEGQSVYPHASFQDVVVKKNTFTNITIQFDSGIR